MVAQARKVDLDLGHVRIRGAPKGATPFWRHNVGLEASPFESRTVVDFGDGHFPPTGRRERAVPMKALEAYTAHFAAIVVKFREADTTEVCSACPQLDQGSENAPLDEVAR